MSTWQNRRGVVYFYASHRLTLTITTLMLLRIAYGLWRIRSTAGELSSPRDARSSSVSSGPLPEKVKASSVATSY